MPMPSSSPSSPPQPPNPAPNPSASPPKPPPPSSLSPSRSAPATTTSTSPSTTSHPGPDLQTSKKIKSLHQKISALESQIASTKIAIEEIGPKLKSPQSSDVTVKNHIGLLHTYNEIRDVGMGLLGMVAEKRGVRVREVYEEFGVRKDD